MTRIPFTTLAFLAVLASSAFGQSSFGFDPVKTCEVSMHPTGAAYNLDCTVTIDHHMGPPMSPAGSPVTLGVVDILSQNGQPVPNISFGSDPASGFTCGDGNFPITSLNGMSQTQPPTYPGFGCTIASDQVQSATQTTLTLQTQVPIETTGTLTNCVHATMWDPSLPDGHPTGPQSCVDIDLDAYIAPPPPPTLAKTCATPRHQADGTIEVDCAITGDLSNLTGYSYLDDVPVHLVDDVTLNGTPLTGATTISVAYPDDNTPWTCAETPFQYHMNDTSMALHNVCTLPAEEEQYLFGASGGGGELAFTSTTLFPAGSTGMAQNCVSLQHFAIPDAAQGTDPVCVDIDLNDGRNPYDPLPPEPVQCEAFTPEVTCNKVTGKPVVTLKNKYAKLFSPKSVKITSLTPGVTVQQSQSNALSVQLTGANPGDTISLTTEAVEKGAGSEPGLDLCCMGAVEVKIPEGFLCEAEQVLEVTKTCDTGINPAIDTDADCEITVHYEGPPPNASNPIKIVEAVTGNPWAFTTTPLSGDNWHCPPVPDATPFTCTISANDEPGANWQNWTSTLIVQMSVGEAFENCVTATAAGGLEDKVCWSTETPDLTIEKLADQEQCMAGQPCTFTINVTNPSGSDYSGPITINDQIVDVTPPMLAGNGVFSAIAPPLCSLSDLNSGACTGAATIPAGGTQSYTVTWIPPAIIAGTEWESVQVTNCASGVSQAGPMSVTGAPDPEQGDTDLESCATVDVLPSDLQIVKTGPETCLPGVPCDYQVTISTTNQPFNGPVLLTDAAPNGFVITAITPTPPGCGANLPANPLACVVPVSLNAGDAISYSLTIAPADPSLMDDPLEDENCAGLWAVSDGASPADYSFDSAATDTLPEGLRDLISGATQLGESCVPVSWVPEQPEITVEKRFSQSECAVGGACNFEIAITNQSATQAYSGPVAISDNMTPAGFVVTGMTPAICAPMPTTAPFDCAATVALAPGQTQVITVQGFVPFGVVPAGTSAMAENCAKAAPVAQGSFAPWPDSLFETTQTACAQTTVCGFACHMSDDEAGKLSVEKILLNPEACVPGAICSYQITVTNTSATVMSSPLTLLDALPTSGTVVAVSSLPWSCGPKPAGLSCVHPPITLNPGDSTSFQIDVAIDAAFAGSEITNCVGFETTGGGMTGMRQISPDPLVAMLQSGAEGDVAAYLQQRGISAEGAARLAPAYTVRANGAARQGSGQQSCVTKTLDAPDDTAPPTIAKTCSAPVAGPFGLTIDCTIVVTSNASPQPDHLTVTETLGQYLDASDTGASITGFAHADPWTVSGQTPVPPATPVTLTLQGSDMPASGQSTITATVQLMNEGYLVETENCASVQAYDAANQPIGAPQTACAFFDPANANKVAPTGAPALTVTKTASGPCVPNVAAQTYACGFDLTVTNTGSAAFAGPMVLGDAFDPGMVTAVSTNGAGWSCNLAGDSASCINGNLSLATGATSSVALDVTVKGQPEGGTFTNCGSVGASDDPTAQAMIVQTALTLMGVDIGAVDGKPGKRTRAAVADLQKQLGLEPTGEIDDPLLGALGVPMAGQGEKSCVTVDLPRMPRPPLQCEKATTRLDDGACVCRFKNMYQVDKTSCGCVKGTEFVAGEGCIKLRDKPKDKPKDKPATLNCDPNSTVLRNGKCQCREEGMERVSKTACAKPKKKREVKICPNGLPEIPGVGCVDIKVKRKEKDAVCDPAIDPERCG